MINLNEKCFLIGTQLFEIIDFVDYMNLDYLTVW